MIERPELGAFEEPLAEFLATPLWRFMRTHIEAEIEGTTNLLIQSPEVRNPPYGDEWIRGRINGIEYMPNKFVYMLKVARESRQSREEDDLPPPIGSILEHPVT